MRQTSLWAFAAVGSAALISGGCKEQASAYVKVEPAHVEHREGSELSKMTLTEKAMERLDVKTTAVQQEKAEGAEGGSQLVVPYSAVMYESDGDTFVYISPKDRTFVREPVEIDSIKGDKAMLKKGPAAGVNVVSIGAAELFGTEVGVGH
jgi:hypothetical protein